MHIKTKSKKMWTTILLLIVVEQGIKIIINNSFLDKRFSILPPILYFEPTFNRYYSWFNSILKLNISKWIHIVLVAIIIVLIYLFYQYLYKQLGSSRIINTMFAFIFSGAACSLIDKLFWDGSLDYILINGFFIFDLKDVYINIFIGLLILTSLSKKSVIRKINDKSIIKDFTSYILRKL